MAIHVEQHGHHRLLEAIKIRPVIQPLGWWPADIAEDVVESPDEMS